MSYSQSERSIVDPPIPDPESMTHHDLTVDCYKRRNRILADAHRAEWWMVIAVLLLIAGMGFVAFQ